VRRRGLAASGVPTGGRMAGMLVAAMTGRAEEGMTVAGTSTTETAAGVTILLVISGPSPHRHVHLTAAAEAASTLLTPSFHLIVPSPLHVIRATADDISRIDCRRNNHPSPHSCSISSQAPRHRRTHLPRQATWPLVPHRPTHQAPSLEVHLLPVRHLQHLRLGCR
jgi:hypothetical protein